MDTGQLGKEGERGERGGSCRRCAGNKPGRRARRPRRPVLLRGEIELLMGNNCSGGGKQSLAEKENSFEHKERKRSAIFSGPWLLASSQRR